MMLLCHFPLLFYFFGFAVFPVFLVLLVFVVLADFAVAVLRPKGFFFVAASG
jgi:hypothetical protein